MSIKTFTVKQSREGLHPHDGSINRYSDMMFRITIVKRQLVREAIKKVTGKSYTMNARAVTVGYHNQTNNETGKIERVEVYKCDGVAVIKFYPVEPKTIHQTGRFLLSATFRYEVPD